ECSKGERQRENERDPPVRHRPSVLRACPSVNIVACADEDCGRAARNNASGTANRRGPWSRFGAEEIVTLHGYPNTVGDMNRRLRILRAIAVAASTSGRHGFGV